MQPKIITLLILITLFHGLRLFYVDYDEIKEKNRKKSITSINRTTKPEFDDAYEEDYVFPDIEVCLYKTSTSGPNREVTESKSTAVITEVSRKTNKRKGSKKKGKAKTRKEEQGDSDYDYGEDLDKDELVIYKERKRQLELKKKKQLEELHQSSIFKKAYWRMKYCARQTGFFFKHTMNPWSPSFLKGMPYFDYHLMRDKSIWPP